MLNDITRRNTLRFFNSIICASAIQGSINTVRAQSEPQENWPQYGFNAANTGYASSNKAPSPPLQEQWSFQPGGTPTTPVISNGSVYIGSDAGTLYALNNDGTEKWSFQNNTNRPTTIPLVNNGIVYFGTGGWSVYGLDVETGDKQWKVKTEGSVTAPPTIANGTVYMGCRDNNVYAYDASTGEQQWQFETGDQIWASPAVYNGVVYVGSRDSFIYAVDSATGELRWKKELEGEIRSAPAIADGTVYVSSRSLYALNTDEGGEEWVSEFDTTSGPAIKDGTIFVGYSNIEDNNPVSGVIAINKSKKIEKWIFKTNNSVSASPVVVDDSVYVCSLDNNMYVVDVETGKEIDRTQTGDEIWSSAAVGDGAVYVASNDGSVYALRNETDVETTTSDGETGVESGGSGTGGDNEKQSESNPQNDSNLIPIGLGLLGISGLGGAGAWWAARKSGAEAAIPSQLKNTNMMNTSGEDFNSPPVEIPTPPEITVSYEDITDGEHIGEGGNADVSKVNYEIDSRTVPLAIKKPRLTGTFDNEVTDQMLAEAERWNQLDDHDHIVNIIDYGGKPLPWIAMEYMDGGHLGDCYINMDMDQLLWTAAKITDGVYHAHSHGVAHLDLKPENILFRRVDDGWNVPKVGDWGLSRQLLKQSEGAEGFSPYYAAPEQFGDKHGGVDEITDIYQLGSIFYELFTGQPPFTGSQTEIMQSVLQQQPTPPSELSDVPEEVNDIILTSLAKNKSDRYTDIVYLRDDLKQLFENI